jgi:V-type H+-transporting ATPase subunit C
MVLYWLCSLPIGEAGDAAERAWARLHGIAGGAAAAYRFRLPEALRVGTLDALLALSDDLAKANAATEGAVNKVRRQLYELALAGEGAAPALRVEGLAPEAFLQRFAWDEAKYPSRRPPADTLRAVGETVARLDEGLKTRGAEYAAVRAALAAAARRAGGSLAVRDLSAAVPPAALVATENLTTLVVVVPKAARADWFSSYEHLAGYVVPRSSAVVAEDGEHLAATVVLFRRAADEFRAAARARGFQAKELPAAAPPAPAPAGGEAGGEAAAGGAGAEAAAPAREGAAAELARLEAEAGAKRGALQAWCLAAYAEAFSAWIHVLAVRVFVESVLRYGLPPRFLAVLLRPEARQKAALRAALAANFGDVGGHHFAADAGGGGSGGGGDDLFSYVSFTLSIEEEGGV